ncbi:MAG: hypothetical protein ACHQEB_01720 [Chitinophagales bacterium]
MKKIFYTLLLIGTPVLLQAQRKAVFKWAPSGLLVGNICVLGEYSLSKHSSLTAKIGIPANRTYSPTYDDNKASFTIKATSFLAGYRMYMSHKPLRGFYFEPYFKYVHHMGEGTGNGTLNSQPVVLNFTSAYNGSGIGIQTGVQFLIGKRVALDFYFFGPEINSAEVNFKTVEVTNTIPWNSSQASEAQQNAQDFLDKIPVIGKKVKLTVDQTDRTVIADYKGLLPGIRAGIAIGIAL